MREREGEDHVQVTINRELSSGEQPATEAAGRQHREDGAPGRHQDSAGHWGEGERAGDPGAAPAPLRGLATLPRGRTLAASQGRRRQC